MIDPTLLDKLAHVIVRVGLNLDAGQELLVSAPVEALPLVRRVAAHAYEAGATNVVPFLADDEMTLAKYAHGSDASFDHASGWLFDAMARAYDENAARLAITGGNPMLLAGQDPDKVGRAAKARAVASKPAMARITGFNVNWCVAAYPGAAWAQQAFPDLSEEAAVQKLAEAIFAASRVTAEHPLDAWAAHNAELSGRCDWLNEQRFDALHFRAPGTDLTLGLADGHRWVGGAGPAKNGITCNANIPTEEVFTTPDARRVNGTARATKPLLCRGTLIEDIEVRFENGVVVEAKASSGEEVFLGLLDTDEGARRLGEVALVPHGSPISQSGLLFYDTLFDENAACHVALGQCYTECFTEEVTEDQAAERGGNQSQIHEDWMIGSGEMDIDGVRADGSTVPVFRGGEWA